MRSKLTFFISLLQFDNVGPTGSWVWTFEIVLDGVGEDVSFAFAVFSGILLGANDNSL
jgi:hypothetical protein